jgi:hypothetical protein
MALPQVPEVLLTNGRTTHTALTKVLAAAEVVRAARSPDIKVPSWRECQKRGARCRLYSDL